MSDLKDGALALSTWKNAGIPVRKKRPRDPAQLAKLTVDIATGEHDDHGRMPSKAQAQGPARKKGRPARAKKEPA